MKPKNSQHIREIYNFVPNNKMICKNNVNKVQTIFVSKPGRITDELAE